MAARNDYYWEVNFAKRRVIKKVICFSDFYKLGHANRQTNKIT